MQIISFGLQMKDQKRDLKIVDWPVTVSVSMHVCMQILRCGSQVPSQDATARSAVVILYIYIYMYLYIYIYLYVRYLYIYIYI